MRIPCSFSLFLAISTVVVITECTDRRIVGGRLADPGEFPYQVSVRRSYNDFHFCGGSVITPRHVLTAAHCCLYNWGGPMPPQVISIVAGQVPLKITAFTVVRNASKIFVHPNYNPDTLVNDIAIIELDRDFPRSSRLIKGIPVRNKPVPPNTTCTVSGWGVLNYNSTRVSSNLLVTTVYSLTRRECQTRYSTIGFRLSKGMVCAVNDYRPADSCQGDSGGPLVCEGLLTGVVSTGLGCANRSYPGIYTDVQEYFAWINYTVSTRNMTVTATTEVTPGGGGLWNWFGSGATRTRGLRGVVLTLGIFVVIKSLFEENCV